MDRDTNKKQLIKELKIWRYKLQSKQTGYEINRLRDKWECKPANYSKDTEKLESEKNKQTNKQVKIKKKNALSVHFPRVFFAGCSPGRWPSYSINGTRFIRNRQNCFLLGKRLFGYSE